MPEKCPKQTEKTKDSDFQLEWTDDVIKLLELALSVHRARSINHGKISITDVVNFFFKQFGLKPGNFFSTYGVMRTRAGSRTKYLDELKAGLEEKMDEDDRKEEVQKNDVRKGRR
ncbi:MAG: RteC domain-containing protein [Prevotella sp.]|nr:RteC domain-containing protein [Prevotella sp.]